MKQFEHRFHINAPLRDVSEFHLDTNSLKYLNPPPIIVQFHHTEPMEEGSITDFTLWMGPIPIRWRALHTNIIPLQRFTDTQIDGPFEHWVHKHQFRQVDETTTEVIDIIRAEFKSDIFYRLIGRLIWMSLPFLFSYRSWKTKKILKLSRL